MVNGIHKSVSYFILLTLIVFLPSVSAFAKSERVNSTADKSIFFIENSGQVKDQFGQVRKDADFKIATPGMSIFIGSGHIHYQWMKTKKVNGETVINAYRLDVTLDGANQFIQPVKEQKNGYYENYYLAELSGVRAYAYGKVIYKNVYNNIDWVLYVQDGGLKYDFIVHPGGNATDIKIKYAGATSIAVKNGDIIAKTSVGSITEKAPYSYLADSKAPVASSYVLDANTVSFAIAQTNETVVIDPSLEWATYMGGASDDFGMCAASDTAGNVYMGGKTASVNSSNVFTSGAHQTTFGGDEDGVVTRYTAGGVRQWSTYYGGNKKEAIHSITVDNENNIVFAGITDSSVSGIATSTGHKPAYCGGASDAFVVKMDITGSRLWATYYGGAGKESDGNFYQVGVICDSAKNIFVAGITGSDTGIATASTQQTSRSGSYDGFLVKFDKTGKRIWGTYYGGTDRDMFTNVNVDSIGTPYVLGQFESSGMGTANTHQQSKPTAGSGSARDILVAKFNQYTGARTWATYYGGGEDEQSRGIVVGDTNFVYICGSTLSPTGIATSTGAQSTWGGAYDMFLSKFDSTGKQIWGTYFGGSGTDHGGNVVIDHKGNLNVTGNTGSISGIATADAFRLYLNQDATNQNTSFDALIAIYNTQGAKVWSTYYGGDNNDYGFGVARGKSYGHIYITGNAGSSSGVSFNGAQNNWGGLNDAFMVKITPDTSVSIGQGSVKNMYCEEDTFSIKYYTTERFRAGNVFKVQLSDASGSFTTPKDIGSAASVGLDSGFIFVQLPPNTNGAKFRIRIVGNAPIDTSYDNGSDIIIKPLPVWPVASNNGPRCSNDTLRLSSTNSSAGVVWSWTGPDNYTASVQNPTRVNMTSSLHSGDYIVMADLNGCTRKDTTTVMIKQAADKPDLVSNGGLCTTDSMVLTAATTSTGHITEWYHLDGTWNDLASNKMKVTRYNVTLADAGRYVVVLKQNGCESKDTVTVNITTKPQPVIASSGIRNICSHDTLFLYSSCPTPGVVYNWSGPGVTRNNVQNPVLTGLTPANSGDYVVAASLGGCATRDTIKNVIIKPSPLQPVAGSNSPLCSDEILKLTHSATGGGSVAVSWKHLPLGTTFPATGGGTTSVPNVQVPQAGDYELRFVHSSGCTLMDTVNVAVTQSFRFPITPVIYPGNAVCPTDTIQLSTTISVPGATYKWSGPGLLVPNGNVASPKVQNVSYSDSGYYVVTVIGAACSLAIDSVHLAIVDTISPPVLTLPPFDCEGDTMRLVVKHPYMNQFYYQLPVSTDFDGPVAGITLFNLNKPDHQGRYIVKVKSGGCQAYDTAYLNDIRPTPARPQITTNAPVCEDNALNLDANSTTAGVTYRWNGPSGQSYTQKSPVVSGVKRNVHAGEYTARAILNGCESIPDTADVVINVNPEPEITSDDVFCEGSEIILTAKSEPDETYAWEGGAGFSGSGAQVSIPVAKRSDAGNYVVTATSTSTGCKGTESIAIKITPLPGKPDATYKEPLCVGDKLELSLTDTSTGAIGYIWAGPNGFTFTDKGAFKNDVTPADGGLYVVTASRLGCTITDTVEVRVRPRPAKPVITSNSPVSAGESLELKISNPETGATFRWTGPNGFASLSQDPTLDKITVGGTGTYTVVTTLDGCSSSAFTLITVNKGDGKIDELILFPNPNNGNFTFKAKLSYDQLMPFEVLNTLGMVVYSDIAVSQDLKIEKKLEVDGSLASGYYIFRIMMSGKSKEIPFTIVR